ncbi:MAG: sulfatase-like hydrolase/transferase [Burkholderiales bacterium]
MRPANLIILFSDEHNPKVMGAAGHPFISTPNLDKLAARGVRYTQASTPCPICVPARAALAVGRYNHEIGYWDNADAYEGRIPSWHHVLRERGHEVVSFGKLHFRGHAGDDHGFSKEVLPMHIVEGKGDLLALNRGPDAPPRGGAKKMIGMAGPGESDYTRYDRDVTAAAQVWLYEEAAKHKDRPWVLFVSLVTPHFPLTAPSEHYYRYARMQLPMPKKYARNERPHHPILDDYARTMPYDAHMKDEADVRRALAGYFGLTSFMDEQCGKVLGALKELGLADSTRILYTADHGDNNGARGLWGKSTMYEESVGVPMILAGPDVPAGKTVSTPTNLVDVFATALEAVGSPAAPSSGQSLFGMWDKPDAERTVFSEYHASGSREAFFMVQDRRYKYIRPTTYPVQLYDRHKDPEELRDVAGDPDYADVIASMEKRLRERLDPAEIDAQAKKRQAELLASHGGWEAVLKRGDLPYSPPPGVAASWS